MADQITERAGIGDEIRTTAEFESLVTRTIADPSAVYLIVREPDGNETSYQYGVDPEIVRDSRGVYHFDLTFDAAGRWIRKWKGVGTVTKGKEVVTIVGASELDSP